MKTILAFIGKSLGSSIMMQQGYVPSSTVFIEKLREERQLNEEKRIKQLQIDTEEITNEIVEQKPTYSPQDNWENVLHGLSFN